jgi:hypothetical protein
MTSCQLTRVIAGTFVRLSPALGTQRPCLKGAVDHVMSPCGLESRTTCRRSQDVHGFQ